MADEALRFSHDEVPSVRTVTCSTCGSEEQHISGFVDRGGSAYAVYFAACDTHDGDREAWLDVVLGTWGVDTSHDHTTFSCRVGRGDAYPEPYCTLVDGPVAVDDTDAATLGSILSREGALQHPWLPAFWEVVDFILLDNPVLLTHLHPTSQN